MNLLLYSPEYALHQTGEISLRGNDLVHHIAGQELVDQVYTVEKLRYPFPVAGRVPNPEQPARMAACLEALQAFQLVGEKAGQLRLRGPRPARFEELARVHNPAYIRQVVELSQAGGGGLAESTYIGPGSYETAALAAGAGLAAAEMIRAGAGRNALALVRPPGHHASQSSGSGFCIFNNVAVLAWACRGLGWPKVLIIDWDLHHGDGTQSIFYNNPHILTCSLHQYGPELYPERGNFQETGQAEGQGFTVNLPLPAKTSAQDYLELFRRVVPALAASFRPDIILVSAGYDGHFNDTQNLYVWDPEGGLNLAAQTYHELTLEVAGLAEQYCDGRYIILLEGGYNLYALAAGVVNTAAAMLSLPPLITELIPASSRQPPLNIASYLKKLQSFHPDLKF